LRGEPGGRSSVISKSEGPLIPVEEGAEYTLLTSEDGASYVLCFKADQMSAHMQGDDAARFQADYVAIKQQFPSWKTDQTLRQLRDQGGYSWLAAQDGS
jgi:hypothetical protein